MAKYIGIEKYIFSDIYNFFLKYKDIPNEDYYWECLVQDSRILLFKYKNHPLCKEMLLATMTQLEHKIGGKPSGGFTHEQWEMRLEVAKSGKPFS